MKKLAASVFAAAILVVVFVAPVGANSGRDSNGNPGRWDNCTGLYTGDGYQFEQGDGWHAVYYCYG